jgi:hypothetical protein
MSVLPPAANGTTIVTGRVGQSAARSGVVSAAAPAMTSAASGRVCFDDGRMSVPEFGLAPALAQGSIDSTGRLQTLVCAAIVAEGYASRAPGKTRTGQRPLPTRQETCKLDGKA